MGCSRGLTSGESCSRPPAAHAPECQYIRREPGGQALDEHRPTSGPRHSRAMLVECERQHRRQAAEDQSERETRAPARQPRPSASAWRQRRDTGSRQGEDPVLLQARLNGEHGRARCQSTWMPAASSSASEIVPNRRTEPPGGRPRCHYAARPPLRSSTAAASEASPPARPDELVAVVVGPSACPAPRRRRRGPTRRARRSRRSAQGPSA